MGSQSCHRVGRRLGWGALTFALLIVTAGCLPITEEQDSEDAAVSDARDRDVAGVARQRLPDDVAAAVVADIVDGDTIQVVFPPDERQVDVRLIGINAPESVRPNYPVECYGPESSVRLAELLPAGAMVYLERDVSDADRFDRLLRHVWVVAAATGDAYLVSEALVRGGYVDARNYPPDDKYRSRLADAERAAQRDQVGLWGACKA